MMVASTQLASRAGEEGLDPVLRQQVELVGLGDCGIRMGQGREG